MSPMRLGFKKTSYLVLPAVCLYWAASFGALHPQTQTFLVIGVRGQESTLKSYCAARQGCVVAREKTIEFPNGNTFVRIEDSLLNRDVQILLPPVLNGDHLMEVLIKIRTARSLGARRIQVVSEARGLPTLDLGEGEKTSIHLTKLLATAGASEFESHPLTTPRKKHNSALRPTQVWVAGDYHRQLRDELAARMGLSAYDWSNLPKALPGVQLLYVAPSIPPVNSNFFRILEQIQNLKKRGAEILLVTPYLPYARTDKADQKGVSVTGRLVADLIETAGTDGIVFVRPHAPQSQGFFSIPTFNVTGRKTISQYLKSLNVDLVISPDAGFQKDATLYADDLRVPVAVINKQRDLATGQSKIHDISGPSVAGKTVAIIDDETASGGTLAQAAEFARKLGAVRVYAVVTHLAGIPSKVYGSPFIEELVVTNTLPAEASEKIKVLSVAQEIADDLHDLIADTPSCVGALSK